MMVPDKTKRLLDNLNNLNAESRIDRIREGVKKEYDLEDEVAILRKMLKKALDLIIELHGEEISDEVITEFNEYFSNVERIKKEIDAT